MLLGLSQIFLPSYPQKNFTITELMIKNYKI